MKSIMIKKIIKLLISQLLWAKINLISMARYHFGNSRIILKDMVKKKNGIIVLCYHSIGINSINPGLSIPVKTFKKHLEYLSMNFEFVDLQYIEDVVYNKITNSGIRVAITFDDGFMDNYTNAFPLLRYHNVPAAIFITSKFIDSHEMYNALTINSIFHSRNNLAKIFNHIQSTSKNDSVLRYIPKSLKSGELLNYCLQFCKNNDIESGNNLIKALLTISSERLLDVGVSFLSTEKILEMKSRNIIFGNHTHSHPILVHESEGKVRDEILRCDNFLLRLGLKPKYFAFPNGTYKDYHSKDVAILNNIGYSLAFTTNSGIVDSMSDPYRLNRILMRNLSTPLLHDTIISNMLEMP
jgi:peptidoglycan/xylan/chitin deacetylase (PgdA/CDA1 family)